jgi:hypothetical protein
MASEPTGAGGVFQGFVEGIDDRCGLTSELSTVSSKGGKHFVKPLFAERIPVNRHLKGQGMSYYCSLSVLFWLETGNEIVGFETVSLSKVVEAGEYCYILVIDHGRAPRLVMESFPAYTTSLNTSLITLPEIKATVAAGSCQEGKGCRT